MSGSWPGSAWHSAPTQGRSTLAPPQRPPTSVYHAPYPPHQPQPQPGPIPHQHRYLQSSYERPATPPLYHDPRPRTVLASASVFTSRDPRLKARQSSSGSFSRTSTPVASLTDTTPCSIVQGSSSQNESNIPVHHTPRPPSLNGDDYCTGSFTPHPPPSDAPHPTPTYTQPGLVGRPSTPVLGSHTSLNPTGNAFRSSIADTDASVPFAVSPTIRSATPTESNYVVSLHHQEVNKTLLAQLDAERRQRDADRVNNEKDRRSWRDACQDLSAANEHRHKLKRELEAANGRVEHFRDFNAQAEIRINTLRSQLDQERAATAYHQAAYQDKVSETNTLEAIVQQYSKDHELSQAKQQHSDRETRQVLEQLSTERINRIRAENDLKKLSDDWAADDTLKQRNEDQRVRILHLEKEISQLDPRPDSRSDSDVRLREALLSRDEVEREKCDLAEVLRRCGKERDEATERAKITGKENKRLKKVIHQLESQQAKSEATRRSLEKDFTERTTLELDACRSALAQKVTQCEAYDALIVEVTDGYARLERQSALLGMDRSASQAMQDQLCIKANRCESLESELVDKRAEVDTLLTEVQKQATQAKYYCEGLTEQTKALNISKDLVVEVQRQLEARTTDLCALRHDLAATTTELGDTRITSSLHQKEVERLSEQLEESRLGEPKDTNALKEANEELQGLKERVADGDRRVEGLQSDLDAEQVRCRRLETTLVVKIDEISALSTQMRVEKIETAELRDSLATNVAALDKLKTDMRESAVQLDELRFDLEQKTREHDDQRILADASLVKLIQQRAECSSLETVLELKETELGTLRLSLQQKEVRIRNLEVVRRERRQSKVRRQAETIEEKETTIKRLEGHLKAKTSEVEELTIMVESYRYELDTQIQVRGKMESIMESLYDTIAFLEADLEAARQEEGTKLEHSPIAESDHSFDTLEFRLHSAVDAIARLEHSIQQRDERDIDLQHSADTEKILVKALDEEVGKSVQLRKELNQSQAALAMERDGKEDLDQALAASRDIVQHRDAEITTAAARVTTANRRIMVLALALQWQAQVGESDQNQLPSRNSNIIDDVFYDCIKEEYALLDIRDRQLAGYESALQASQEDGDARATKAKALARKEGNDALIHQARSHRRIVEDYTGEIVGLRREVAGLSSCRASLESTIESLSARLTDKDAEIEDLQIDIAYLRDENDVLRLVHCEDQITTSLVERDAAQSRSAFDIRSQELADQTTALLSAEAELKARNSEVDQLRARQLTDQTEIKALQGETTNLEADYALLTARTELLRLSLEGRTAELQEVTAERDSLLTSRSADQETIKRFETQTHSLRQQIPRLQFSRSQLYKQVSRLEGERNTLAQELFEMSCDRGHKENILELVTQNLESEREKAWAFVDRADREKRAEKRKRLAAEERAEAVEASFEDLHGVHARCGEKRKRVSNGGVVEGPKRARMGFTTYASQTQPWAGSSAGLSSNHTLGLTVGKRSDTPPPFTAPKVKPKPRTLKTMREVVKGIEHEVVNLAETDSDDDDVDEGEEEDEVDA